MDAAVACTNLEPVVAKAGNEVEVDVKDRLPRDLAVSEKHVEPLAPELGLSAKG